MTPVSPKGPERGARPYSVVELRDRIAQEISDADGGASSVDPDGDATYEQMADAALAVVAPEVERLTFERDAAQAAADLLVQQLEDLRDDVLGDESLLVPEIVSAAGRTVERLTAEASALRADLRIRQGALNDVLGRERSADYYSAVEDVAELKRENGRLTTEVERLRSMYDLAERQYAEQTGELKTDRDHYKAAHESTQRGLIRMEVQRDEARTELETIRGELADFTQESMPSHVSTLQAVRWLIAEHDGQVKHNEEVGEENRALCNERDEWKRAAEAETQGRQVEVSRLREQLTTAREQVERTRRAERRSIAAVLTGMLEELEMAYVGEFGDGPAESRDKLRAVQAFSVELDEFELGVSSSEAPQPQEMVQHTVEIRHVWRGVGHARCLTCGEMSEVGIESYVQDWADRHVADTLRPQAFQDYDLTDVKPGTGFFVPKDEGRPSGSEAAPPRPVETFDCKQDCPAVAPECFCVGPDAHRICCHTVAAQAARSEATPQDPLAVVATETEPSGAVMTECPDGAQCHRECVAPACIRVATCGPMSRVFPSDRWPHEVVAKHGPGSLTEDPSPSLRKEGEDR